MFTAAVHGYLDHRPLVQPGESIHSQDNVHARVPTPTHCCDVYLEFPQLHYGPLLMGGGKAAGNWVSYVHF